MSLLNNVFSIYLIRSIFLVCSRSRVVGRQHLPPPGTPGVLAMTHLSHYDPIVVGALLRRKIDFMARAEFYRTAGARWSCEHSDCIRIDRYGHALPGIREARQRLQQGRLVGIFPEGEIMRDGQSVLLGGPLKGGAALLARRSGVPIYPCVVLNSEQFRRVVPWLPLRKGRLWVSVGPALHAPDDLPPGRPGREALSAQLADACRALYREIESRDDLPPEAKP
jgi:1-acyl-sn-glycerol-3-phosphate acyltransferase